MWVPSTQALRALDSFARHGSVWRAADELHLTRSAISHQLRLLERELGFAILRRAGKGVELTPQGRRYAHQTAKALALLASAGERNEGRGLSGSFAISCTPGFASLWLCPRIAEFGRLHPGVSLSVLTPRRLDDVSDQAADAFIAYGDGAWENKAVEPLCEVAFTPLCAPSLLNRLGGLQRPADVLRADLLHLDDTADWARWLALAKVDNPDPAGGIYFSDMNLAFSAAVAGQGIAMGDELTSRKALHEGRLVKPFDLAIKSPRSYFLVCDHAKAGNPVLDAFARWLRARLDEPEALALA
ncbi:MAG: transcriptional regulator [Mesorhizobium amorphae]|nr:MAG: transcriptional regulator [Mesorhizobium amorphae]